MLKDNFWKIESRKRKGGKNAAKIDGLRHGFLSAGRRRICTWPLPLATNTYFLAALPSLATITLALLLLLLLSRLSLSGRTVIVTTDGSGLGVGSENTARQFLFASYTPPTVRISLGDETSDYYIHPPPPFASCFRGS